MTMTDDKIEIMKEDVSADLVSLLTKNWQYTIDQALEVLYNSDTFSRLEDSRTGLYYQSPGYVYSFLEKELATGNYRS